MQHSTINNLGFGRSVDETLRVLQAIQYIQANPDEVCKYRKPFLSLQPLCPGLSPAPPPPPSLETRAGLYCVMSCCVATPLAASASAPGLNIKT